MDECRNPATIWGSLVENIALCLKHGSLAEDQEEAQEVWRAYAATLEAGTITTPKICLPTVIFDSSSNFTKLPIPMPYIFLLWFSWKDHVVGSSHSKLEALTAYLAPCSITSPTDGQAPETNPLQNGLQLQRAHWLQRWEVNTPLQGERRSCFATKQKRHFNLQPCEQSGPQCGTPMLHGYLGVLNVAYAAGG